MPRSLRDLDEPLRAVANLGDRAGRRAELGVVHGLDRVDDDELWFVLLDQRDDAAHVALTREPQAVDERIDSARRGLHLRGGLLAGEVEAASAGFASDAAACSSSVDLPMPGSPPTSVTEPGTSPPPSTRSSSPIPVDLACHCRGSTWVIGKGGATAAVGTERGASSRSSTSVFHAPQPGQRPAHWSACVPQSVHEWKER